MLSHANQRNRDPLGNLQALLFALSIFADFPVWSITYIYGMFALSAKHGG